MLFRQTSFRLSRFFPLQRHFSLHYNQLGLALIHYKKEDPMIGDYPSNVPFINRQTRTPYDSNYFDVTERRKFGEPLHEQDEILGMFSPDVHSYTTPSKALLHLFTFGFVVATFCSIAYALQPKPVAVPRESLIKKLERPSNVLDDSNAS
ncbi:uncharacterized protein T551_00879 [Pneumocystis jirovecii RU7]|uniref:Uncharacterized protein n=1 Tax=Pneumocystis jirovecii (strain RU7) TaxID=1408657 RepID=A0A0W4ZUY0_PNEJ7|nr:uncharacterized protein T551_00879 [Pneumocystis jirovecii RU7]KTW32197.1 hypothetical protein T551_00879 [Pneumocystis jirovecii RU7]